MFAGCCKLCGAAANAAYAPLCRPCWSALPMMGPACCRCSVPLPRAGICGRCALSPPEFSRTIAAFRYQLPVDHLIQQFKYAGRVDLAMVLAAAIVQSVAHLQPRPDCIIPVPLHPARQRGRGFNQAALLGGIVARRLGISLALDACRRIRNTPPQAGLDANARRRNLRGAFAATGSQHWRHVALIDDVFTTGDTAAELTAVLKNGGVERVDVWVCARTV